MSTIQSTLRARREQLVAKRDGIVDRCDREQRTTLTADETEQVKSIRTECTQLDARIDELDTEQRAYDASAAVRRQLGDVNRPAARVTSEPTTYRSPKEDPQGPSFFADIRRAQRGDMAAIQRLARNQQEVEHRALDLNTSAGTGGEFAPPAWLVDEFVRLARPGRVTADLCNQQELMPGVSSLNLPKVATGTATAVQGTQGTSVQDTALTTTSVTSGIRTIAGQQTVSLQLLEQAGNNFDQVVLQDLAADYAVQLDTNVLSANDATYHGILNVAGIGSVTYTDASPAVAGAGKFYAQIAKAIQTMSTTRFLPPTAIVMHPRRWAWCAASFDSSNRPLMVPSGAGFNGVGVQDHPTAEGAVGSMLGLPVYLDPNLPTNLGAGANQDVVLLIRGIDLWLWESQLRAEAFDATYAGSLEVLFRVYNYSAFIGGRYPASVVTIGGTGLVTPVF